MTNRRTPIGVVAMTLVLAACGSGTATATIIDPTRLEFEYAVTFRDGIPPATGRATLTT